MDQQFWDGVGSNLGHAYRIVLDNLGYPVARTNGIPVTNPTHPVGNEETASAEAFAEDYNEVVRKNPQLGFEEINTYGLDLSDARYDAMQRAIELASAEQVSWPDIVSIARNKNVVQDAVSGVRRTIPPLEGDLPTPDPGDGPPDDESVDSAERETSGGSTALVIGAIAAAAFFFLQRR